jgi:AcrR family transcriptional regulator
MQKPQRTRRDPRREATRIAIIKAAESMFAQAGIEGVSNRQIGSAIGSLHNNLIAYHFGSKEVLIEAIYHHRLPDLDQQRAALLAAADTAGKGHDFATLMDIAWRPLFEQTNDDGKRSFAGFLSELARTGLGGTRTALNLEYPETNRVSERLRACLAKDVADRFDERQPLIAGMIFAALQLIDREGFGKRKAEQVFEEALVMACAALIAPVPFRA